MHPFTKDLLENVFCRINASPIHGVGVFAIRPIPKGVNPMKEKRHADFVEIPVAEIKDNPDISEPLKRLVLDMCPEHDGVFDTPPFSLNEIGLSYYLNHSMTPNMTEEDGEFVASRNIAEGEELTVDYGTYGALNL